MATSSSTETTPAVELESSPDDQQQQQTSSVPDNNNKWPGWPGYSAFRVIVPDAKVGTIIGRKGDLIRKLCEETRARVRILDPPPVPTTDRIVLVSAKEELEAVVSPAMDAVIRVFKRVNGLVDSDATELNVEDTGALASAFCSLRLLVASAQALSLIGKQGSVIKSIQESSEASVRVLTDSDLPPYIGKGERIIELQGEAPKVHKALEGVLGHLRKYLVDHSVLPLFEKYNAPNVQERPAEVRIAQPLHAVSYSGVTAEYSMPANREMIYLERDGQLEGRFPTSVVPLYESDIGISGIRSSGIVQLGSSFVTQVTKTMQIPLLYAEDIIGIAGTNIAYIRRTSGAVLTVQESKGLPEEITVEIKGTSSQVQVAQRLIQDFISNHKEPVFSDYGYSEMGLRSSLLPHSQHTSSPLEYGGYTPSEIPGRLGSTGVGDLGNTFRL